jgi:hypothetical protein
MTITQTSSQNRSAEKRAVIGGGMITAPAVAAHARRKQPGAESPSLQSRVSNRQAVIGGGMITTPTVAAHIRSQKAITRR